MQNQRHGEEGHQFKAHVHGHGICSQSQCNERRVGQHEEAEETVLPAFMGHVAKGVELDKAPDKADQNDEENAQAVSGKAEAQRGAYMHEGENFPAVCEGGHHGHNCADDKQDSRNNTALLVIPDYKQLNCAQHGEQYG